MLIFRTFLKSITINLPLLQELKIKHYTKVTIETPSLKILNIAENLIEELECKVNCFLDYLKICIFFSNFCR